MHLLVLTTGAPRPVPLETRPQPAPRRNALPNSPLAGIYGDALESFIIAGLAFWMPVAFASYINFGALFLLRNDDFRLCENLRQLQLEV